MVNPFLRSSSLDATRSTAVDAGLRAHMQRIFAYMGGGLAITGFIAYVVANTVLAGVIFGTPLKWLAMLAPFAFVFFLNIRLQSLSASAAKTLFWLFCGAMGLSMATIFMAFTDTSIARAFFITAATFSAMSLWGYTTRKDLTGFGAFLMMGMLGLFIASIVNIFMGSTMLQWIVSIAGVGIFTGLTAYQVQSSKRMYNPGWGEEANAKMAVIGALNLYLNFINAFQFLLALTGERR